MPNVLTDAQVAQYKRENFLAPFPALTETETRHYRDCLENYERTQGGAPLEPWQYRKLHVREEWAADLVRIPRVASGPRPLNANGPCGNRPRAAPANDTRDGPRSSGPSGRDFSRRGTRQGSNRPEIRAHA